jgi:cbb3-type cytochrome oxidase subunit 3
MINTVLIILVIICLAGWTFFSMRRERKFNEIYAAMLAIRDMTDEKALEYVKYVTQTIKNKGKVLSYSAWSTKS